MTIPDSWNPKVAVVELRRNAPKYLDRQGIVAQKLLDNYDAFSIDASPVRYLESLVIGEDKFRAAINGHHAVYQRLDVTDLESFERESRAYFKLIEAEIAPTTYDRVGALLSFPVAPSPSFNEWFREVVSFRALNEWTVEDASLRLTRSTEDWQQVLTVRRWGTEDDVVDPSIFRIDVDQFRLQAPRDVAWGINMVDLLQRARQILHEITSGEVGVV